MEQSRRESKLAKKLRMREEGLPEDQKRKAELLRMERQDRLQKALAESLARDKLYYESQRDLLSRIDNDELTLKIAEAEAESQLEAQQLAVLRLKRKASTLARVFSSISADKLTRHAAERMLERHIQIMQIIKRSVTVIDRPGFNGKAVILTAYKPK